ncbi:large ribosomal subunit protein uL18m [Macrobrachium rosenbergii]|uniref:large ribosomal subunit protein uL18m n=1 Tax=Macrobrachium rosenbergii TaxID=79674 RepID=UPI0034D40C12
MLLRNAVVHVKGVPGSLLANLRRGTHSGGQSSNDDINPVFVNRNPRNMEMLRIARKPQGYALDEPTNHYWYRLEFEQTQKHIIGRVEHYTGTIVVSASTKEWAIKQHLYSNIDVSAAENIGRILAHRCLQSGICEVHTDLTDLSKSSEKLKRFIAALEEGGVHMKEPGYIGAHDMYRWKRYHPTLPWQVLEEDVLKEDKERSLKKDDKEGS